MKSGKTVADVIPDLSRNSVVR